MPVVRAMRGLRLLLPQAANSPAEERGTLNAAVPVHWARCTTPLCAIGAAIAPPMARRCSGTPWCRSFPRCLGSLYSGSFSACSSVDRGSDRDIRKRGGDCAHVLPQSQLGLGEDRAITLAAGGSAVLGGLGLRNPPVGRRRRSGTPYQHRPPFQPYRGNSAPTYGHPRRLRVLVGVQVPCLQPVVQSGAT